VLLATLGWTRCLAQQVVGQALDAQLQPRLLAALVVVALARS